MKRKIVILLFAASLGLVVGIAASLERIESEEISLDASQTITSNFFLQNPGSMDAALGWYGSRGLELEELAALPDDELGLRLLHAVYNFCEVGVQPSDINLLFEACTAACGGYSYVLRGLLEALGRETRFVHLHNIPNQGNHTAVEFATEDGWAFLDPTFGAAFSSSRGSGGRILSLREVAADVPLRVLYDNVLQAETGDVDLSIADLNVLFSDDFSHQFMSIENYQLAEFIDDQDGTGFMMLDIPLDLYDDVASLAWEGQDFTDQAWLAATNATLLDADPLNDVSFNAGTIQVGEALNRSTSLSLFNLDIGSTYRVRMGFKSGSHGVLAVAALGKSVVFASPEYFRINEGYAMDNMVEFNFTPLRDSAVFYFSAGDSSDPIYLRGLQIDLMP